MVMTCIYQYFFLNRTVRIDPTCTWADVCRIRKQTSLKLLQNNINTILIPHADFENMDS